MILMTAALVKVILLVICAAGIFALLRRHCSRKNAIVFACCAALVGGLFAQKISSYVPPLTDVVTITAMGEKNEESLNYQIGFAGFTVDGESVMPNRSIEGKWFWNSNSLFGRTETDPRQPEGTTRTIKVEVPVGNDRYIHFTANKWTGKALVECGGIATTVDTYSYESTTISAPIAKSTDFLLSMNQVRYLLAFAVILLPLASGATFVFLRLLRYEIKIADWFDRHFWVVYLLIATGSFFYMVYFSAVEPFWQDELATISNSLLDFRVFRELFIEHKDYYPSIFLGLIYKWYHVAPYGEQWLLLPLELVTAAGVFFTALSAEKIKNRRTGLFAAVFSAFSQNIIFYCGFELRTYGFMYCAAAVILYLYIVRTQRLLDGKSARKQEIGLAIWIFLAAGCHVFGVFYAGLLFLIDVYFWITKRIKLRFAIPYIAAALVFTPWIYNMLCYDVFSMSASFQAQPTFSRVIALLKMLSGNLDITYYILIFAVVIVLVYAVGKQDQKGFAVYGPLIPLWLVAGMIGALYFYGTYINTQATMWSERYFVVLFPSVVILLAIATNELLSLIHKKPIRQSLAFLLAAQFIIMSHNSLQKNIVQPNESFRDAGDWFYTQGNTIYNDDSVIVFCGWWGNLAGWKDYYLEEQGRRDPLNVIYLNTVNEETLSKYKTVYLYYEVRNGNQAVNKILDEEFEMTAHNEKLKIKTYVRK